MIKNGYPLKSLLFLLLVSFLVSCSGPKRHYQRTAKHHTSVEREKPGKYHRKSRRSKIVRSAPVAKPENLGNTRSAIVYTAKKYIGIPYTYGGKKPQSGFDCSGFISYVFTQNGVPVTGASHTQAKLGKPKSKNEAKPGDLVFFGNEKKISHVAIVTRNSGRNLEVIHSTSSRGVVVENIDDSDYWRSRYLFTREVIR